MSRAVFPSETNGFSTKNKCRSIFFEKLRAPKQNKYGSTPNVRLFFFFCFRFVDFRLLFISARKSIERATFVCAIGPVAIRHENPRFRFRKTLGARIVDVGSRFFYAPRVPADSDDRTINIVLLVFDRIKTPHRTPSSTTIIVSPRERDRPLF